MLRQHLRFGNGVRYPEPTIVFINKVWRIIEAGQVKTSLQSFFAFGTFCNANCIIYRMILLL